MQQIIGPGGHAKIALKKIKQRKDNRVTPCLAKLLTFKVRIKRNLSKIVSGTALSGEKLITRIWRCCSTSGMQKRRA